MGEILGLIAEVVEKIILVGDFFSAEASKLRPDYYYCYLFLSNV